MKNLTVRKHLRVVAVAMIATLTMGMVSGCGNSSASSTDAELDVVRIGTIEGPDAETIAKVESYFEETMGVEVEITSFDSGSDVNIALASKSIDLGYLGSSPATIGIAQDIGIEVIAIHQVLGAVESLAVKSEYGVESVEDLEGLVIATPFASTTHYSLLRVLDAYGISTSDVTILDMQASEIVAAWETGSIDAAYIWEPMLTELSDKDILLTSGDAAEMGFPTFNVEVVRTEFAEAYPEIVVSYLEALDMATVLYQETPDTAVSIIASALEITEDEALFQMEGFAWLTSEEQITAEYFGTSDDKGMMTEYLYDTAVFLTEQGSIETLPELEVIEAAINPSYLEAAAE